MTKIKSKIPKITPRHSWVLVKPIEPSKENKYGVIIPDSVEKEKKAQGEVIKLGPDVKDLKVGQRVLYGMYAGEEIQLENKSEQYERVDFVLLLDEDILATLE